ncbi:hypothetical protein Dimus_015735, partial [Dionaea muscipula]
MEAAVHHLRRRSKKQHCCSYSNICHSTSAARISTLSTSASCALQVWFACSQRLTRFRRESHNKMLKPIAPYALSILHVTVYLFTVASCCSAMQPYGYHEAAACY